MTKIVLGIESSCDETSASICLNGKIINNIIVEQSIHEQYGGVVPELASREHQKNIIPAVKAALAESKIGLEDLDAIAVTQGPGLLGALLIGYTFSKSLAFSLNIPLINVNHLKAHVLAHFIDEPFPSFPFICLTVSGGHTMLVLVSGHDEMTVIGNTLDDAAGEAFDKGAKLLGLPYPGGPTVDKLSKGGDANRFSFSESKVDELNYSFSGIKTSLLYFLRNELRNDSEFINNNREDLCASYQNGILNMLFSKLIVAADKYQIKQIAIAGGVAANSGLRSRLLSEASKRNWEVFIPKFEYCTDNAAMIAKAGYFLFEKGITAKYGDQPKPRFPI